MYPVQPFCTLLSHTRPGNIKFYSQSHDAFGVKGHSSKKFISVSLISQVTAPELNLHVEIIVPDLITDIYLLFILPVASLK